MLRARQRHHEKKRRVTLSGRELSIGEKVARRESHVNQPNHVILFRFVTRITISA
jgi:hypothetical protein